MAGILKENIIRWVFLAAFVALIIFVSFEFISVNAANRDEQLIVQLRSIERAAVLCFALEGAYPPCISYLEENYGLIVNRDRFIVLYNAFSSNIRPEVRVYHIFGD